MMMASWLIMSDEGGRKTSKQRKNNTRKHDGENAIALSSLLLRGAASLFLFVSAFSKKPTHFSHSTTTREITRYPNFPQQRGKKATEELPNNSHHHARTMTSRVLQNIYIFQIKKCTRGGFESIMFTMRYI